MYLLKTLQILPTYGRTPWIPTGNAETRYLINEIVTGQESDVDANNMSMSHFEMYLNAMKQAGVDTNSIDSLIGKLSQGLSVDSAILSLDIHPNTKTFVRYTFDLINNAPIHVIAAVFTFGRDDLIP